MRVASLQRSFQEISVQALRCYFLSILLNFFVLDELLGIGI